MTFVKIKRALISVSDKTDLINFATYLHEQGIEILSTGGTEKHLKDAGIPVKSVSDYTGFPEMMDGRVKTLHPKVFGAILGMRGNAEHMQSMQKSEMLPIDLVVVNLYPFQKTVAKPDCLLHEAIENIDIGGPSMIRAAAKNYPDVAVVVDPEDYHKIEFDLKANSGELDLNTRFYLAKKAFTHTAAYDGAISNYLTSLDENNKPQTYPKVLNLQYQRVLDLRYGENPHQKAAYYSEGWHDEPCVGNARLLQGKQLSFNNLLDLNAALEIVKEFEEAACVIIKHNNPCGVAISQSNLQDAYQKALRGDPVSAFGGIIGFNREVDEQLAVEIAKTFYECIVAPDYTFEAKQVFAKKKDLRLLKTMPVRRLELTGFDAKKVVGGLLVQDRDLQLTSVEKSKVVTTELASVSQIRDLNFAWRVCKHVKSNAIVYAKDGYTVGIGAGQMSRVDSVKFGAIKAGANIKGCVMASDAFFPFRDSIDEAKKYGITAIIQPGGSIRDQEVIDAANEHKIPMYLTNERHFKH